MVGQNQIFSGINYTTDDIKQFTPNLQIHYSNLCSNAISDKKNPKMLENTEGQSKMDNSEKLPT
jgi:hypothetical protein